MKRLHSFAMLAAGPISPNDVKDCASVGWASRSVELCALYRVQGQGLHVWKLEINLDLETGLLPDVCIHSMMAGTFAVCESLLCRHTHTHTQDLETLSFRCGSQEPLT